MNGEAHLGPCLSLTLSGRRQELEKVSIHLLIVLSDSLFYQSLILLHKSFNDDLLALHDHLFFLEGRRTRVLRRTLVHVPIVIHFGRSEIFAWLVVWILVLKISVVTVDFGGHLVYFVKLSNKFLNYV